MRGFLHFIKIVARALARKRNNLIQRTEKRNNLGTRTEVRLLYFYLKNPKNN